MQDIFLNNSKTSSNDHVQHRIFKTFIVDIYLPNYFSSKFQSKFLWFPPNLYTFLTKHVSLWGSAPHVKSIKRWWNALHRSGIDLWSRDGPYLKKKIEMESGSMVCSWSWCFEVPVISLQVESEPTILVSLLHSQTQTNARTHSLSSLLYSTLLFL